MGATLCALAMTAAPALANHGQNHGNGQGDPKECKKDCVQPGDPGPIASGGTSVSRMRFGPFFSVSSTTNDTEHKQRLNQSATGQVISRDEDSQQIRIQCVGNSFPNGIATGVRECYAERLGGDFAQFHAIDPDATPGPLDATVSSTIEVPVDDYKVCVLSRTMFFDTTFLETPKVCS